MYGTAIALLLVIAANFFVRGGHDAQRTLEVVFLLGMGAVMLINTSALCAAMPRGKVVRYSLIGFFVLGTLASVAAFAPRFAAYEVGSLLLLLLVGLSVGNELAAGGTASTVRILFALGGIGLLYAFKLAVVYGAIFAIGAQPDVADFAPGFNNQRFLNHTQTMTLPLAVALLTLAPSTVRARALWLLLAALGCALLAVTSARGTAAGVAAGCVVALVLRRRHALPFLKMMALSVLAGAVFYYLFFVLIPLAAGFLPFGSIAQTIERTGADPASGRMFLWTHALDLAVAHPLLGVGPLHFAHQAAVVQSAAHPHNLLLQIGAEWGLPALLCLCLAIGAGALGLVRSGKRIAPHDARNQHILTALIVTGAALLVDSMVSGSLVMPQSQLTIALYLGCAVGWSRSAGATGASAAAPVKTASRFGAGAVVVAAMLGVAGGVWPEIVPRFNQEPLTAEQQAANNPAVTWPRLWHAGFF